MYDFYAREFRKHGGWNPANWTVYLPNGVYRVRDTLIYRGETIQQPKGQWRGENFDVNHLRFVGQNRGKTVIRLDDRCPGYGYGDPARSKIFMAFQHPDTVFNNVPGGNYLRNLTIDAGRGNPGAVGLYFQGANQSELRNVTVRSGDGAGKQGVPIRVAARRDVVQRCAGGALSNPNGLPVTFFLENVNDNASGDDFCRKSARFFAQGIDVEYGGGEQVVCNGGRLWIFGYKTENARATPFTVKNGGALEILGGYTNTTNLPQPEAQNPLVRVLDGDFSGTLFTNLGGAWVRTIKAGRRAMPHTAFPKRGGSYDSDIAVPLYSVRRASGSEPPPRRSSGRSAPARR